MKLKQLSADQLAKLSQADLACMVCARGVPSLSTLKDWLFALYWSLTRGAGSCGDQTSVRGWLQKTNQVIPSGHKIKNEGPPNAAACPRPTHEGLWKVAGARLLEQKASLADAGKASEPWLWEAPARLPARFPSLPNYSLREAPGVKSLSRLVQPRCWQRSVEKHQPLRTKRSCWQP